MSGTEFSSCQQGYLFRGHLSCLTAVVCLVLVRMVRTVIAIEKSRVRDVFAGGAIVVVAVDVQKIFASHTLKPQCPSSIPTA